MQPEAGIGPHEQAAQSGKQDSGGGRVGGEIGGCALSQRRRRVKTLDVDRRPSVVDTGRAPAVAPAVGRPERRRGDEQRPVARDAQRMRAFEGWRIEADQRRAGQAETRLWS
jgi:hypothetical protein